MAKMNKIMPPRNTTIRGQDHLLAYITPEEAQMLMDNGGTGEAGPMGIPSYPEPGMGGSSDSRSGSGNESGGSSSSSSSGSSNDNNDDSGNDGGITAEQVAEMARAQQDLFGGRTITHGLSSNKIGYDPSTGMPRGLETVIAPDGQVITSNLGGLTEAQRSNLGFGMNIAGLMGSNPYGYEIDNMQNVIGQIGTPGASFLGQGISALQNFFMGPPQTLDDLLARGVYTGPNAPDASGGESGFGDMEQVKPVNPETGQCDAGYMFDEDMQACRLDTGFTSGGQPGGVAPESGAYARMGLLDVAPTGLPEFQQRYGAGFGTPSEFADANLAFRRQGAYRPEYFDQPYPTTGYTLLS